MSTLLDAAIVLGAGPPVICVRHRVCHTLCHSVCHSVPPCATVCQPPGASTIIWQTRANIQTPPSVNPVVTNPLLLGSSPIFEKKIPAKRLIGATGGSFFRPNRLKIPEVAK